jgi:paraquat-inducible protein A
MAACAESSSNLVLCPDCDLLQQRVTLAVGGRAYCCRCHAELYRETLMRLDVQLALALTGALVFCMANLFPIVSLQAQGAHSVTTLFGTVVALWSQDMQPVALLVFLTAIMVPMLELATLCYLLLPLSLQRTPPGFRTLLHLLEKMHPWGMAEVFLMGVLVALVKLAHLADVAPGIGLWSFGALIVLLALNASFFDSQGLWRLCQQNR